MYIEETARACHDEGASPVVWAPDYGLNTGSGGTPVVRRIRMRGKQDWICRWRMGRAFANHFPLGRVEGTIVLAEPGPIRWWMYSGFTRPPVADRLVVVLHGSELAGLAAVSHRRHLLGRLLHKADAVGVVSQEIRNLALSKYPAIREKVVVVPGAVRSGWRDELPAEWQERRRELIQVGRIHPRKGQLALVEAVAMLPRVVRDAYTVRLIGPVARAGYVGEIRKIAKARGVRVEHAGVLSDAGLISAYRHAALTVMPSQAYKTSIEGLGMALLEAQHFGCPVIGSDCGGIREALIPGETGLLVPPGNAAALADAIRQLLENPRQAEAMGKKGAEFVRNNFSWTKNIRRLGLI